MLKTIKIVLIGVVSLEILNAQVVPPFMGDRFSSFRLLSTAGLIEDDLDLLLDPGRYFEIESNNFYTGLSNIATNQDQAFSGIPGGYFMFGFNTKTRYAPLALLYVHSTDKIPAPGEQESFISERYDSDGDGRLDSLHTETEEIEGYEESKDVPFFIGVSKDLGNMYAGLFFFYSQNSYTFFEPGDRFINPFGNFYYKREERDLITGNLLEIEEWDGKQQRDSVLSLNLFGGSIYIKEMLGTFDFGIQIGFGINALNHNTQSSTYGYIDYNPGGSVSMLENTYRIDDNLNAGGNAYFIRLYSKRSLEKEAEDYFYFSFIGERIGKATSSYEVFREIKSTEELGTGTREDITKITKQGNREYEEKIYTFLLGYRYKDFVDNDKRILFSVGFFVSQGVSNSTHRVDTFSTEEEIFNDGDTQPSDPDDYTRTTTYSLGYESAGSGYIRIITLPVGCELRLNNSLFLRLGAEPYFVFSEMENTTNPVFSTPRITREVRGDGSETETVDDLVVDSGSRVKLNYKDSGVFYSYGLSYKIGDKLTIDLMNFANLTNLQNWRISVIFRF
jgi:hypothetical protein